jgi:hypothetical protein
MPWEVAADERRRKLEELRKERAGGTGPLSAARQQKPVPKGLPARQPLSGPSTPPTTLGRPAASPAPNPAGRQIETGWDASAAVNATFNAYQQIKERQEALDRQANTADAAPSESTGGYLTKGPTLNRDAISAARGGEETEPDAPAAAGGPSWLVAPIEEAPMPTPRPSAGPTTPPARTLGGKQASTGRDAGAPRAPRLQTGTLSNPGTPSRPAAGAGRLSREPLAPKEAPRREPMRPVMPEEAAPVVPELFAPEPVAPELESRIEAEEAVLLEEPTLEELIEEEPMLQGLIPRLPSENDNPKQVCRYLIVDGDTKKALSGARIEFEPTQDDRLPVVNGQADFEGWFNGEGIPPGLYQVTVRSAGYIPQSQTHYIKAGEVDEGIFHLKKP